MAKSCMVVVVVEGAGAGGGEGDLSGKHTYCTGIANISNLFYVIELIIPWPLFQNFTFSLFGSNPTLPHPL